MMIDSPEPTADRGFKNARKAKFGQNSLIFCSSLYRTNYQFGNDFVLY